MHSRARTRIQKYLIRYEITGSSIHPPVTIANNNSLPIARATHARIPARLFLFSLSLSLSKFRRRARQREGKLSSASTPFISFSPHPPPRYMHVYNHSRDDLHFQRQRRREKLGFRDSSSSSRPPCFISPRLTARLAHASGFRIDESFFGRIATLWRIDALFGWVADTLCGGLPTEQVTRAASFSGATCGQDSIRRL